MNVMLLAGMFLGVFLVGGIASILIYLDSLGVFN